ncbi:MAG: sugar transferase [Bacteroidota bacterium]
MKYHPHLKRILDIFLALIGLLLASPILLLLGACLFVANNGKALFLQRRPGKGETIFKIIKFKTMNDKTDTSGALLPSSERITKIGAFARKYSLDEIPQLFNVLNGDMSLIGPRPLRIEYLDLYSREQARRHDVRPGITGWAQVNGRNAISWTEKFNYDIYYIDHLSFGLDIKILLKTIKKVLLKEGINSDQNKTMPAFTGNN